MRSYEKYNRFLPVGLGYIWATSPDYVFILAAGIALLQILLSLLVPRNPSAGNETRWNELRSGTAAGAVGAAG